MRAELVTEELIFEPVRVVLVIESLDELDAIRRQHRRFQLSGQKDSVHARIFAVLHDQLRKKIQEFLPDRTDREVA